MTLRWDVVASILAMGIVTYFCRAGGYALWRAVRMPPFVQALIRNLPAPLFAAYVALALARQDLTAGAASVVVVIVQWRFANLGLSILVGVAAMAGLRWAGF
ncbi:AzlD family protein [Muricoccus radiodurans]|uniref:AzlD family protein n=1 Tax=Muricoccus radiodurans TaxID=2231721 RepID=UPI003CF0DAEF